jgi:hypothetical protein
MVTAVVIFILLTVAASLASWLFGQWLAGRTRVSSTALAFQSCEMGEAECRSARLSEQRRRYEPAGILMTAANDKPVLLRVADGGPLVAPIFTIPDVAGTRRQIRYAACLVTAPRALGLAGAAATSCSRIHP